MPVAVRNPNACGSLTKEALLEFESSVAPLPDDFRSFLLKSNGGQPVKPSIQIGRNYVMILDTFHGIHDSSIRTRLRFADDDEVTAPQILKQYLVIAEDSFGNDIVMSPVIFTIHLKVEIVKNLNSL